MKTLILSLLLSTSVWAADTKALNPDIGLNILGLVQRRTTGPAEATRPDRNGLSLQEVELQFKADVDPHFRAVALLGIHQESGSSEFAIHPEEAYFETRNLPSLTLRGGKFFLFAGKHNTLHAHAFPFIDAPLINQKIFGDEGLNEGGISASYLLPTSWFSEVTVQAYSPSNENLYISDTGAMPPTDKIASLAHFKNLLDLNGDATAELGLTGGQGKNGYDLRSTIYGGDFTYKWRPAEGGKYTALIWSTEYLLAKRNGLINPAPADELGGLSTWVQYQFAQQWWVQGRTEWAGLIRSAGWDRQNKYTVLLGYFPSEFSGFRLQYDHTKALAEENPEHRIALQFNISIGAHPAHAY